MAWRGSEEIEEMCKLFTTFTTTPALQTAEGLAVAGQLAEAQAAGVDNNITANQSEGRSLAGSQMDAVREDVAGEAKE